MGNRKHIIQRGSKQGTWGICRASQASECPYSDKTTHIDSEHLQMVKKWLRYEKETNVSVNAITTKQLLEFDADEVVRANAGVYTPPVRPRGMGARQNHGLEYEKNLAERFGFKPWTFLDGSTSYTAPFDAMAPDDSGPVSIKTKHIGSAVELGSWHVQSRITDDFYMAVSFWGGEKNEIIGEKFLFVPADVWHKEFPEKWREPITKLIRDAKNDRSYDDIWKEKREELTAAYEEDRIERNGIIQLAPKRDHKTQKRMQCSIPYDKFVQFAETYETTKFDEWKTID